MERKCYLCGEILKKGMPYHFPMSGAHSVRFDKVKVFEKLRRPVIFAYVCMKCGNVELGIEKLDLLKEKRVYL